MRLKAATCVLGLCLIAAGCKKDANTISCTALDAGSCGMSCMTTADCGSGLYCGSGGKCVADCVQGSSTETCPSGKQCTAFGQCVDANTTVDGGVACPTGLQCNVSCSSGSTTITGKVYDPALKNGLYNITVYVPATALTPLPKGVPTGAAACSCSALYTSGALTSTSTAEDGTFTLTNAPVGTSVPLVLQVGKWRKSYHINVTSCQANAQPDKSLALPGTIAAGDTDDNMPDIAVSSGKSDSLECLMRRIGLPTTEYVAGTGTPGHVHVFSGGCDPTKTTKCPANSGGTEPSPMANAPSSPTTLWSTSDQLMAYDVVLLSCEGAETYDANPQALETYLNAGGRVFASHFHYAWFSGPLASMGSQTYTAPSDWGSNLAMWSQDGNTDDNAIDTTINQTLNGSMSAFPKGVSLDKFLGDTGALESNGDLSITSPRYNAIVTTANTASQPWITSVATTGKNAESAHTMYFSFDTPVVPTNVDDPMYCGRAVFSDLHVSGGQSMGQGGSGDTTPPDGCVDADLSPQEKALEFMLFDLSSCVIADNVAPPTGTPIQ